MKMTKESIPKLVQLFTDLLWANSPYGWTLKSTYFRKTLFIAMLWTPPDNRRYKKRNTILREFSIDVIHSREKDLWGMAKDCVQEMKSEIKTIRPL